MTQNMTPAIGPNNHIDANNRAAERSCLRLTGEPPFDGTVEIREGATIGDLVMLLVASPRTADPWRGLIDGIADDLDVLEQAIAASDLAGEGAEFVRRTTLRVRVIGELLARIEAAKSEASR